METKTICAYNVSRNGHLSPKVIVVDRADQPLTILRLIVEGLGLKSQTSLWLTPLRSAPQLVRPFPFDLAYLDKDLRVIRGVELLPEVPFPAMGIEVASALLLPLHTLSETGTREGDRLLVCTGNELAQRLEEISSTTSADSTSSQADEPAAADPVGDESAPAESDQESMPAVPPVSEPLFVPMTTRDGSQGVGFTVALTTTWQIVNSTTTAVAPVGIEGGDPRALTLPDVTGTAPSEPTQPEESENYAVNSQNAPTELTGSTPTEETESPGAESAGAQEELQVEIPKVAEEVGPVAVKDESVAEVVPDAPLQVREPVPEGVSAPTGAVAAMNELDVKAEPIAAVPLQENARRERPQGPEAPKHQNVEPAARPAAAVKKHFPQKKKGHRKEPEPAKPEAQEEQKKGHLGLRVIRWLNLDDPPPDRRTKKRYLMPGLVAYTAEESKAFEVRDVGPTGFYLKTPKPWKPGQIVSLTLRSEDAKERNSSSAVRVQARTVRSDKGGSVLAFVFPENVDFEPWNRLHTRKSSESDAEYFVRELRLAKAFGFLRRICEPATEQIRLALHERFSNKRVAGATEIALKTEEMLSQHKDGSTMIAHPHVVMRILEDGSWADDDWVRHMWAGLLATSCTHDGLDTSNSALIDVMDKLTPIHLKILGFACRKRAELASPEESFASLALYCSGDELVQVAGLNNLARIQQTIGHLANYGLLAESARPSYVGAMEKIKTKATPTALGLQLHARCSGQWA